jgi:hypothetical protein
MDTSAGIDASGKRIWLTCVLAGLAAVLLFMLMYGFAVINPHYTAWVLDPDKDIYQAYLGWRAFRISEWRFPWGLYDCFSYPETNSIIFTDSIPGLALFFKLFRDYLPQDFQYFGMWTVFCYFMNAALAARILQKHTDSRAAAVIGAIFFSFVPSLLLRTTVHAALTGQWLVILALTSLFFYRERYRRPLPALGFWLLMGILAASVHMYFVLICGIVLSGYCLCSIVDRKNIWNALRCFIAYIGSALLVIAALGGFSAGMGTERVTELGYGEYSFNLNSLWNARDKAPKGILSLLRKLPWVDEAKQAEGFSYLGLGILLMLVIAAVLLIWRLLCGSSLFFRPVTGSDLTYGSAYSSRRGVSRRKKKDDEEDRYAFENGPVAEMDAEEAYVGGTGRGDEYGGGPGRREDYGGGTGRREDYESPEGTGTADSGYVTVSERWAAERKRLEGNPLAGMTAGFAFTGLASLLVAASNVISFNDKVLFTYPLPHFVLTVMEMFRSSGRVAWVLVYMIMLFALILTLKMHPARVSVILLAALLAIQGGEQLITGRVEPPVVREGIVDEEFGKTAVGRALSEDEEIEHLIISIQMEAQDYYYFGKYAVDHGLTLNDFWFARPAHEKASKKAEALLETPPEDTAFVFFSIQSTAFDQYKLYFYDAGKYAIGCAVKLDGVEPLDAGLAKTGGAEDAGVVNTGLSDETGLANAGAAENAGLANTGVSDEAGVANTGASDEAGALVGNEAWEGIDPKG